MQNLSTNINIIYMFIYLIVHLIQCLSLAIAGLVLPFSDIYFVFSCKDAAQQVLMSVCPSVCVSVCLWSIGPDFSRMHAECSRMLQYVTECMQNVQNACRMSRMHAECSRMHAECMQNVPEGM